MGYNYILYVHPQKISLIIKLLLTTLGHTQAYREMAEVLRKQMVRPLFRSVKRADFEVQS